jgi:lipopolysaccharide transport system permease protein/teichoic acid transport system permease protein
MNLIRECSGFLSDVYQMRSLIFELTKRDFKQHYIGSFLGLFWAFLEPLITMLIMWFIFTYGFKARVGGDVPFVAYLFTGMVPFTLFQSAVGEGAGIIRSYAFLVQKMNFKASILPLIKLNSALILHVVFLSILIGMLLAMRLLPSFYWLQLFYYLAAMTYLILGLNWLISALGVFVKDITHVITILLRLCFWFTPIFWHLDMMPESTRVYFKISPIFYLVQGYRETFIYHKPFWDQPLYMLYFWAFSTAIFVTGVVVFKRLRPHFAEVL